MRRYHKWLMALGIAAATPGVTLAGPFSLTGNKPAAGQTAGAQPAAKGKARSNQEIADDVAKALRAAKLQGYNIEVGVQNGVAKLSGSVATPELRGAATKVVGQVPGVQAVDNRLTIGNKPQTPVAGTRPAAKPPAKPSKIQQVQYQEPAEQLPQVQAVQAQAPEGQPPQVPGEAAFPVTAPSQAQDYSAVNQQMANAIGQALKQARFRGYDIEIMYKDGVAVLAGSVASPDQKVSATNIVSQVAGVQRVDNQLTVANPAQQARYAGQGAPPMAPPPGYGPSPIMPAGAGGYGPPAGMASHAVYDQPNLPQYAWPSYATYPNYAQANVPKQYSASAWPYIGPFYPYPQVPLGWRKAQLEWDDGYWNLNFHPRTDRWWWFFNPANW